MSRLIAVPLLLALTACDRTDDGYAAARALMAARCAACHVIPGVRTARGRVGPSLAGVARRRYIAGRLPNTPGNLRRFLDHPQSIQPGGAMPELELTPQQSTAIADYLGTLDTP
jgi:cytochrome c